MSKKTSQRCEHMTVPLSGTMIVATLVVVLAAFGIAMVLWSTRGTNRP
jgi:hypothetical protein